MKRFPVHPPTPTIYLQVLMGWLANEKLLKPSIMALSTECNKVFLVIFLFREENCEICKDELVHVVRN